METIIQTTRPLILHWKFSPIFLYNTRNKPIFLSSRGKLLSRCLAYFCLGSRRRRGEKRKEYRTEERISWKFESVVRRHLFVEKGNKLIIPTASNRWIHRGWFELIFWKRLTKTLIYSRHYKAEFAMRDHKGLYRTLNEFIEQLKMLRF